jgi:hypothetical protein
VCVSTWFVAIRAALWLDETVSLFLTKGGFAGITSCQVWFAVILPALLICFLALKIGKGKSFSRQLRVALVAFALASLPFIGNRFTRSYLVMSSSRSRGSHSRGRWLPA